MVNLIAAHVWPSSTGNEHTRKPPFEAALPSRYRLFFCAKIFLAVLCVLATMMRSDVFCKESERGVRACLRLDCRLA